MNSNISPGLYSPGPLRGFIMSAVEQQSKRSRLIQLIHIGKSEMGVPEKEYRSSLYRITGKQSCTEMSLNDLERVLSAMKQSGFTIRPKKNQSGMASESARTYIRDLWQEVARIKTEKALCSFTMRLTGISSPDFLDRYSAQKVILALRKMCRDVGIDPNKVKRRYS